MSNAIAEKIREAALGPEAEFPQSVASWLPSARCMNHVFKRLDAVAYDGWRIATNDERRMFLLFVALDVETRNAP